jgi:hypothetical protein
MKPHLVEYRATLVAAEQKSQDDYDKTIVSLSGGALGISIVFLKDIIGESDPSATWAIVTAWSFWALSLTSVVVSYFFSRIALSKSIVQTDQDNLGESVGGWASTATSLSNSVSGISFILGVVFLIYFATKNIGV